MGRHLPLVLNSSSRQAIVLFFTAVLYPAPLALARAKARRSSHDRKARPLPCLFVEPRAIDSSRRTHASTHLDGTSTTDQIFPRSVLDLLTPFHLTAAETSMPIRQGKKQWGDGRCFNQVFEQCRLCRLDDDPLEHSWPRAWLNALSSGAVSARSRVDQCRSQLSQFWQAKATSLFLSSFFLSFVGFSRPRSDRKKGR